VHATRLDHRLALLRERLAAPPGSPRPFTTGPFALHPRREAHAAAVERCRAYIAAGDLYQANLTLRLDATFAGEAVDLFATTSSALSPARGAYVGDRDAQVASLSPELFLERRARAVRTAPIKGTVRRTGDPAELEALRASAKDAAEHVMIVDLMRNDLGRVSAYGSVHAPLTPRAEEHPGVWHLVSDVTGTLRDDVTDADLLRATFPPGSVTGAPKVKALEVIATLESTGREVYTGAIGFCSPVAGLELSVAIRTFEVARGRVWLGAGGGVVADSEGGAEVAEALVKAAPLLGAAGGRLADAHDLAAVSVEVPPPTRLPRPDPRAGILETLLAVDGVPVELDRHLDRLARSVHDLLGERLDRAGATARVAEVIAPNGPHRVRLVARPGGELDVTSAPVDPARLLPYATVALVALTLPGGAGRHKWADRRLLDAETGDREVLVVDLDGQALETGRGTLWIAEGDRLVTPPADGRILDGTVRAALLEHVDAVAEPIDLARVARADELLVTSSIRGVQAAHLEGAPRPAAPGPKAQVLAARLGQAWRLHQPAAV
jgi:para-aminobenzoate synthetase/4-amino-4-deoxychorismate lyase